MADKTNKELEAELKASVKEKSVLAAELADANETITDLQEQLKNAEADKQKAQELHERVLELEAELKERPVVVKDQTNVLPKEIKDINGHVVQNY